MTKLDDAELKRLRGLCDAATDGEWSAYSAPCCPDMGGLDADNGYKVCQHQVGRVGHPMLLVDAELCAAARTALPAALDEIEILRELLEEAEECLRDEGYLNTADRISAVLKPS